MDKGWKKGEKGEGFQQRGERPCASKNIKIMWQERKANNSIFRRHCAITVLSKSLRSLPDRHYLPILGSQPPASACSPCPPSRKSNAASLEIPLPNPSSPRIPSSSTGPQTRLPTRHPLCASRWHMSSRHWCMALKWCWGRCWKVRQCVRYCVNS
jgi:hypothetical protein